MPWTRTCAPAGEANNHFDEAVHCLVPLIGAVQQCFAGPHSACFGEWLLLHTMCNGVEVWQQRDVHMRDSTDLPCARQEEREVGESAVPERLLYTRMLEQTFQLSLDDDA